MGGGKTENVPVFNATGSPGDCSSGMGGGGMEFEEVLRFGYEVRCALDVEGRECMRLVVAPDDPNENEENDCSVEVDDIDGREVLDRSSW